MDNSLMRQLKEQLTYIDELLLRAYEDSDKYTVDSCIILAGRRTVRCLELIEQYTVDCDA